MKAHMVLVGLLSASVALGCGGNEVPDPEEPKPKTKEPTLEAEPMPEPKPLTQGLTITASPNVEVLVDGEKVGTTPLEVDDLEVGEHDVTFLFEGDNKTTVLVELGEGQYRKVHQSVAPTASDARIGE